MNLQDLSKDALVEVARLALGRVGDSARTPKPEYVRMLETHHDAEAVAQAVATVTRDGVPMRAFARPAASADPAGTLEQLRGALSALGIGAQMDEDAVRAIVADEVAKATPRPELHIIREGYAPAVLTERTHPVFAEVLDAAAAGLNVLLTGPAGCGKSHLAHQVATALGRQFGTLHCSAGASESQLTGWLLPVTAGGAFEFVPSQFASMYADGNAVFLIDEIDAADANMLMVLNGALANGHLHIPQRHLQPVIPRGPELAILAAANTYGTGADMLYVGRNQLDAATLDRFYVISMDYDAEYEADLVGAHAVPTERSARLAERRTDASIAAACVELGAWVQAARAKVAELRLRRVVSTRTLQKGLTMLRTGHYTDAHIRSRLLAGWTADEKAKLGGLA